MFHEHTTRRYIQGSSQKFKTIALNCLAPIASTQINNTALICWTGLIGFTILVVLYLFQRTERKRYENKKLIKSKVFLNSLS